MTPNQAHLKLNNGCLMPLIGFGTSVQKKNEKGELVPDDNPKLIGDAISNAIIVGYRHFDCGSFYGNEAGIGSALKKSLENGSIKRQELFVATKVWNSDHKRDRAQRAVETSLKDLQLDYVDLVYIHWPCNFRDGDDPVPREAPDSDLIAGDDGYDYLETYAALEELVDLGKVKALGLSNFDRTQVQRVIDNCRIPPAVLEIEVHVYLQQNQFETFCRERNIALVAYSPLAAAHRAHKSLPRLENEPVLIDIAKRLGKSVTPQQVALAFLLQRGIGIIPRALSESNMRSNSDAAKITLSDEDMLAIRALDKNMSTFPVATCRTTWSHLKDFPKEALGGY